MSARIAKKKALNQMMDGSWDPEVDDDEAEEVDEEEYESPEGEEEPSDAEDLEEESEEEYEDFQPLKPMKSQAFRDLEIAEECLEFKVETYEQYDHEDFVSEIRALKECLRVCAKEMDKKKKPVKKRGVRKNPYLKKK